MSSDMITAVSGAVDSLSNLVSAPVNDYYAQKSEERQEQANIRAEEREQGYIISSEKRANKEYDRRLAEQRRYDSPEAVASRYAQAGINPVSAFSSGVVGQSGSVPASGGKAPSAKPITAQRVNFTPTDMVGLAEANASIKNINAQTKLLEQQTSTEYEKGMSQFIDNCWQKYISGDRGNPVRIEQNFKYRYNAFVDDDGNLEITNYEGKKKLDYSIDLTKYVFESETYGNFSIYDAGYKATKEREELAKLIGGNEKQAEDLAQSIANLYLHAWQVVSQGKAADAAMLTANANFMAANFNYGDEYNAKWWLKTILECLNTGANITEAVTSVVKMLPKGSSFEKVVTDGDGVIKSITTQTTK